MTDEIKNIHITTDSLRDAGGVDAFLEIWGRKFLRMDMEPLNDSPLDVDLTIRALPGFALGAGSISPVRNKHTSELLDDDDFIIVAIQDGGSEVQQFGRTATVNAGEAVLTANGSPATFTGLTKTQVINFRLSRDLLKSYVADLETLAARPIPRAHPILGLMIGYTSVLSGKNDLIGAEARRAVALHMHDLAALLLNSNADRRQHVQGLRAARLLAIKEDILAKAGQHGLSIADVARRQQISESYVRQLFAADGTTFTDFVLDLRLSQAHRFLIDPRYKTRSISEIAYEVGFGDLSYFNRTFRKRFKAAPSDVRSAAADQGER